MEIILIDEKSREIFDNLAPAEFFSPFDLPDRFRMGAVGKDGDGLYAAGVLIFDVQESLEQPGAEAVLQWLYVAKDSRRRGVADALMSELFDVLSTVGVEKLVCELPMEDEYDLLCAYLEAWDMQFTLLDRYECILPLEQLLRHPNFQKKPGKNAIALSDCNQHKLLRTIWEIQGRPDFPETLEYYLPECDPDVSCVALENGMIKGLTLVRKLSEDSLELLLFRTLEKSPRYAQDMLLFAGLHAKEKYTPDTLVRITCHTGTAASLIDYFNPDAQPRLVRRGVISLLEKE